MKHLLQINRFMVMLVAMLTLSLTNAFAGDAVCKTSLFAEANNSGKISSYTSNWYSTTDGFRLNIVNFNNNNNSWGGTIKAGGKKSKAADPAKASTASFATNDTINSKVTKIVVTGSLANNSSFTSTTLTIANDKDLSSGVVEINGPTSFSSGVLTFTVSGTNLPAAGKYYKLTFNISNNTTTNGCFSVTKVEFYKETGGGNQVATPAFMIGGTEVTADAEYCGTQDVTISCSTSGAAISYSTNGGTSWNAYSKPIEVTETATLQAKATKSGLTDSEVNTKIFTINAPIANDSASAYTTAKAIEKIDAGKCLTDTVFVKGTISKIDSYSSKYYSITYWLDNNTFQVYSGKGLNGANFSSIDDIKVGAEVVVKGLIKKFGSGESAVYEFDKNNYLVAYKAPEVPKTTATISLSGYKQTLAMDDPANVVTIKYNGDGQLAAESSDPTIASVALTVNETDTFVTVTPVAAGGPVTITVSAPETDNFTSASKYYTLTVSAGLTAAALPFSFDGGKNDINPANGIKQSGLGGDYSSSPKLKFDDTDDEVIIKVAEKAVQLSYSIKGAPGSGDWAGQFDVLESVDGVNFDTLKSYTAMAKTVSYDTVTPTAVSRYFKFVFTNKSNGNVALGAINIIATLPKQDPQFSVENMIMKVNDVTAPTVNKGGSTGAITYVVPENDYIFELDGEINAVAAGGPVTVTANMAADDNYNAASTTFTVTVKDEEFAFKTITSFALEAGYLEMFQYKAFKGNSITEPAVYSNVLRIYKPGTGETTGGYITLTALPGYKIRGVEMPITKSANTVGYAVDGGEAPTSGTAVSKGESYKLTGIECNSVSLYNMGSDRIDISSIIIYYSGELETVSTLATTSATKTEYEVGDEVNHAGAVVTATFASGDFDVTLNTAWVDPDMTTAGQKQVKATFASQEATYNITVNEPAPATLDTLALSGTYQTVFQQGDEFNHTGMVVTAIYTDETKADVTSAATFSEPAMTTAGQKVVTVSYTEAEVTKKTTYNIIVKGTALDEETVVFANYFSTNTYVEMKTIEAASMTITYSQGTNTQNAPTFYNSDKTGRVYKDNTFKISATRPIYMIRFVTKKFDAAFTVADASSFKESAQSGTIIFDGTSNEVTMTAAGTVQMYSFTVYYTDQHETFRSGLAENQVGSGCQAKSILAVRGGAFYTVESGNTETVTLKEIKEYPIAAGQPAIFKAESNKVEIIYGTANATKAVESEEDGLVGLVSGANQLIDEGNILVSGGRLRLVGADCYLTAGHAYISTSEMEGLTPNPSAPGRRLVLTRDGITGMMNVNANVNANGKFIMDGQMFILRDGKMFNAQGQLVK